ncbi:putative cholinephosphate cytidylyltransferase A [Trypanosoma cruzi]|uniref:ethanolamine-phosphate cytidylyltransferase n=2 Tax=Trypanosoma cruzi TaxID=5693 RepID=Q4CY09_TRYCC|nr:cholinephosphate cytidylyltransferase A, putative [Trypanosoma cruzi]EAN85161.1 cholinephosphate cytidylyltransferase A, putative [Trypanosoma cruzi]PWV04480.1 putative cholinephosphate cytidylyltransferase A [Trypanosoma cruzi]|eukprot:XP_807012.1 cholinephosphate cytidylyltransferase A [Trypanosoma cruzi strain CL Brener]
MSSDIIEHSFFFTPLERDRIAHAETFVDTRPSSFVTVIFSPLWQAMSRHLVPEMVAPNAITLAGLVSSMQSYQIISDHYDGSESDPNNIEAQTPILLSCLLCLVAIVCGSLDGVHAKRCRSASPLGDIFSRVCSSISRIFFALTLMEAFSVRDLHTKWYLLMAMQLVELNTVLSRINADNLKPQKAKNLAYHLTYCFRDSELSFLILCALITRLVYPSTGFYVLFTSNFPKYSFLLLVVVSFVNVALLKMKRKYKSGIALCLVARVVPLYKILLFNNYSVLSVISGALVVALLSIEVHVSNVARRRVHAGVLCISIGSVFNDIFSIVASVLYIIGMLVDLSYSTRIPLFVPVRNVFCDGVFDLCHAGHKNFMQNALQYGNRLIVGVCGDEDCENYKRRPIMTTEERVNEVRMCKFVSQVISNSPVTGVTEEMIKRHNIHVVVCGKEYDRPDDTFYAVPRRLGILRTAPRTEGISTSVLIARIRAATDADVVAKDKSSGRSVVRDGS